MGMLVGCIPAGGSTSADGLLGGKACLISVHILCFLPCGPRWECSAFHSMPALGSMPPCMMNFYPSGTISQPPHFFKCKLFASWYSIAAKRRNEHRQHPNGQVAQGFRADPSLPLKMDWFKKWKLHMHFLFCCSIGVEPWEHIRWLLLMVCLPVFWEKVSPWTSDCPSTFCVAQGDLKLITVLHPPPRCWD